jgi:Extensin-like protein C-terminus
METGFISGRSSDGCRSTRSGRKAGYPVDEPTLSCRFGERFGHWLRDLVAPLIAGSLTFELESVRTGPGYECRNRNRTEAGKISAHASGLAADVASFELANGETLAIKPNGDEHLRATVDAIRFAACGWFTTVLGPGSDAAHADHMHVDILQRRATATAFVSEAIAADQSGISDCSPIALEALRRFDVIFERERSMSLSEVNSEDTDDVGRTRPRA